MAEPPPSFSSRKLRAERAYRCGHPPSGGSGEAGARIAALHLDLFDQPALGTVFFSTLVRGPREELLATALEVQQPGRTLPENRSLLLIRKIGSLSICETVCGYLESKCG